MVVREVIVVGGILLVGYGVYSVGRRLRRRWGERNGGQEREPLIGPAGDGGAPAPAPPPDEEEEDIESRPSPSPWVDIHGTAKRQRSGRAAAEGDEDWKEPAAAAVDYGSDMGSAGGLLFPADRAATQNSNLFLEVIAGPSAGLSIAKYAKERQSLSLTLGRIPQNDLVINDPEVSGKHALISWNAKASKWELIDMGSLNGTLVSDRAVAARHAANAPARRRGHPVSLANGDVVTLGSTSQVLVKVSTGTRSSHFALSTPFGVGVAADCMTIGRGGKQLPMEDVSLCEWPLRGYQEVGMFCIFDGHGGAAAAEAASRLMPEKVSKILGEKERRAKLLSQCDATDVLQDAFRQTEASLEHEYEGCTATVLLIWWSEGKEVYAQCANVGDSACAFSIGDKHVPMTEDHRLTSFPERCRLLEMGKQLKDGETRLCGMNIARALGDKFLKEQDGCFSSQPFVSDVVRIDPQGRVLVVMASDGLWDVMSQRRALNYALEARDGRAGAEAGRRRAAQNAEGMAEMLVSKARALRTKDNTSVIVLDFGCNSSNFFRTI